MYNALFFWILFFCGCFEQSENDWEQTLWSIKQDYDNGEEERAIVALHKEIAQMEPDVEGYIEFNHALYNFYNNQEKWKEALPPLERSISAIETSNLTSSRKRFLLINRYGAITLLYSLNNNRSKAIDSRKEVLRLLKEEDKEPERIFMQHLLLGDLFRQSSYSIEEAKNSYGRAQQLIDRGLVPVERQEEITRRLAIIKRESSKVSDATQRPGLGVRARQDKLWALGTVLVQVRASQIEWGAETLEAQGVFGVCVFEGQLIWLEKNTDGATLHLRIGDKTQSKSILWFGQEDTVTSHMDGETIWLVDNGSGSARAMQFATSGEKAVQVHLADAGNNLVTDAATDPNGGLWIATQNRVKRIRKDETISLEWSNTSPVSQLLVTKNQLWILTIDGKLTEVDLNTLSIVNEIALPGAGVAVAHTNDGLYVATGVLEDRFSVHIHRLSKDGTIRWTSTPQSIGERTLVAFDDRVVYGSVGDFVTLDVEQGTVIKDIK